jgi:hypothetical protein
VIIEARVGVKPAPNTPAAFRVEGYTQAIADSVLRILYQRGIPVSPENRKRITGCTDFNLTQMWFEQVFDVASAEKLTDLATYDDWD